MLSSDQTQFLSDFWKNIGLEVTIFAVTLACAFALRALTPQQEKGKRKHLRRQDSPLESKRADVAKGHERLHNDACTPLESGRSAAAVLDEAMACLQEWQGGNGQPASKVLSLYSELRSLLRRSQRSMQDATRASKHRPCDFYSGLVHLVIRAGKQHLLNMVIDDMIHQNVPRSVAFYESAMKQLATQKQFRQALSIYDRLVQDGLETSTITYSCLVRFAAQVGELSRAKEFFEKLASITTPSIRAYMTVLSVHNKRQDWSSAAATIHDMKSRGVAVDSLALNVALSTGVAADKVTEVQALLSQAEEMTPFVPDVVSYNTVVKAYSQRGNYVEACKVVDRMRKNGVKPNAITFNTVMDAAVRGGKPEEAWRKLQEMQDAGYKPDKFSCSIIVKALTKSGASLQEDHVDRALVLLEQNDRHFDMTLKMSLYNNTAEASSKANLAASLRKVKAQMRSKGVTSAPGL